MTLTVTLPWPPKEVSPNARVHWRRKHKAAAKQKVDALLVATSAMRAAGVEVGDLEPPLRVKVDFYPPDRRARDQDNMVASMKSALDGVSKAIGVDDKHFRLEWLYLDEPCKGGEVVVTIEGGDDERRART
jgi:crossover junction endodeoxyribonuclease RusA